MSDEQTLAQFLATLSGTLEKINDRLERLEGQPSQAEVEEQESFPDWNEDVESARLRLVPPIAPPVEVEHPSALGEAFKARAAELPRAAPPAEMVIEKIGGNEWVDPGSVNRGGGHVLTDAQIARDYQKMQQMKRFPGRMAEDGPVQVQMGT